MKLESVGAGDATSSNEARSEGKRVLGFDNWTGGAHLFARLRPAFVKSGLNLKLIHLGSWGNDPGRPSEECIQGLNVRDITYYGQQGFERILEVEKPDAVVFMSTDTFAHRAFNRYCKMRGIPTVHVYHGLVSVQDFETPRPYKTNVTAQLRFAGSKVIKAIRYVWPVYGAALWRTGANWRDWRRFALDILNLGIGKFNMISAEDARTDHCCVYAKPDVEHAVKKYGFSCDEVSPVGNPDLIQFGLAVAAVGAHPSMSATRSCDLKSVVYIDTGLVYTGWVFTSASEYVEHLVETNRQLGLRGRRLVFKPHPDHWRRGAGVLPKLKEAGIEICDNESFISVLNSACAAIVETSTAALIPALVGMPLLLAAYGRLHEQKFGKVLTSYPRSRRLTDLSKFDFLLDQEMEEFCPERTKAWIMDNSGPQPAEQMPLRVARVVQSLIENKNERQ